MGDESTQPRRGGTATAEILADDIVRVRFSGHVNGTVVEQVLPPTRSLLADGARAVVFDTTAMSSFDSDVRKPGFDLLSAFRNAGVMIATVAVTSSAVRMMGAAIAFGAGLPLEFFSRYDEAHAHAKALAVKKR